MNVSTLNTKRGRIGLKWTNRLPKRKISTLLYIQLESSINELELEEIA